MDVLRRNAWLLEWVWFLAWGLASSAWCWTAARELGATFDEPIYVQRGLEHWRTGSHRGLMQLGTMPLPVDIDTLPLYLWERGHHFTWNLNDDWPLLLPWARTGTLLFWWLLLVYGRLAGRQLAGPVGGCLAVALLASEPNLLAHASLATTDIAVTACLLALVYHFRIGREAGWFRRVGIPALWFGAALLAKASGLVFGCLCLLAVECERLAVTCEPGESWKSWLRSLMARLGPLRRDGLQIVLAGGLLAVLYCGSDWQPEPSFVAWAQHLPAGRVHNAMTWLAEHLCIFSNAAEGFVRQVKHNVRGHGTYLLGHVADRAIWYYFPVVLTIKLTLAALGLPLVLGVLRPRSLWNWAMVAALALLAFSVTCRVQIGIRLILPLVALALVGLGAAAGRIWNDGWLGGSARWRAVVAAGAGAAAIAWSGTAALSVWPNGLCYTNELWGGVANGYLALSDSNYDWGQGLPELARWQEQHSEAPLAVWYFGTDPELTHLPMREIKFHTLTIANQEQAAELVRGRFLAVATTLLHGSVSTTLPPRSPGWTAYWQTLALLRSARPIGRTTTFVIYDFTGERAPATAQAPLTAGTGDRPR